MELSTNIILAVVNTICTVTLAVLNYFYIRLTKQLYTKQTDPKVIVYVRHSLDRAMTIQLVIKNIGESIAENITFTSDRPIILRASGLSPNTTRECTFMSNGPLINGIPALAPSEERIFDWGQYGGLSKALGGKPLIITCHYMRGKRVLPPTVCPLEVESYQDTTAADSLEAKSVKALQLIEKHLHNISQKIK